MDSSKPSMLMRLKESNHKPLVILRCKVVIVGDGGVGKTAMTQVFLSGGSNYPKSYMMSIGAEFAVKQIPIPDTEYIVEFFLYDCAGQSIFNQLEMNAQYYENASALMVVFDISSRDSLLSCAKWNAAVRNSSGASENMIGVLVGAKADLRNEAGVAQVGKSDGAGMAAELGLSYFEVSAESNKGIDDPFQHLAREYHRRYLETSSGYTKESYKMSSPSYSVEESKYRD